MKKKKILLGLGSFAILGLATVLASCDGEKTYTVTFYNGTTEVTTQTVTGGYNAEVPTAPTKEGSKFNGWYADEALTTAFDFGSIIEGDTAVYAGWVNESAVVFKDGSTTLSTQTVLNGSNVKVPTAPTATGKRFNGWYKDAACTQAFDFGSVITSGTTVYAGWVDQYTVTFKDGGRTLSTVTVEDGNLVDVPTTPTKENKVFAGWFTDQTYATAYDFGSPVTSSKSVYAKWDSVYYTVSLYIDANTKWKDIQVEVEDVLPTDLAPTKNYSAFNGKWYTDAACTQLFVSSTPITEATTLYAGWDVQTENVTYNFDYTSFLAQYPGGSSSKTDSIVTDGHFYVEAGVYFESGNSNPNTSKVEDDINNQQKAIWFTNTSSGVLSFDFKGRSTAKFSIYKIAAVADNTVVPTVADSNKIFDYATSSVSTIVSGAQGQISINLDESATYVIKSTGSGAIYNLKYTDTVAKSAPQSISVSGARNEFLVGAEPASTGITCSLIYANGSKDVVKAGEDVKSGFVLDYSGVDFTKEGTYTVNVNYTASDAYGEYPLSTSYEVNVYAVDSIEAFTFGLDSSRNTQHNQLVYAVGDTVTTDKVYVHAYGEIGESAYDEELTNEFTFNTVDTSTTGKKTVTATYTKDTTKTSSFDVQVVEKLFDEKSTAASVYVNPTITEAQKVTSNLLQYVDYDGTNATYVFGSITEALQYFELCGLSDEATKTIILSDGEYREKVFIDMPNVNITGATQDYTGNGSNSGAVITFNAMNGINAPNGANYSTDGAASFTISKKATNCSVANVTLQNDYNTHEEYVETTKITTGTQATAVLVRGDMAQFYNVSFSGYHDTLYADQGRQYYNNCYIEGRTDYIFGTDATAVFEDCVIKTLGAGLTEKNGGYVVATKGTSGLKYGYVFNNCTFTADDQTQAGCVSIARGWEANMTIMVMNCNIDNHFSKGTYGQGYYEVEDCTAEKYEAAFATGIYTRSTTYNEFTPSFTAVASTATFNAEETYFVKNGDAYVVEAVTEDGFAAAVEAGLYTVKFDSTKTYFAKNGEEYVEQYLTKDTFITALETGLYTAKDTYTKEQKSADDEYQFDANKTYYVQLNDRYTKMNAAPTPSLLFEYNNDGDGAIAYDANLANRYARLTFTLMNPESAEDQAEAAKYADAFEVFAAKNGSKEYSTQWLPNIKRTSDNTTYITVKDAKTGDVIATYDVNTYIGIKLASSQVKEIIAKVKAALEASNAGSLTDIYTTNACETVISSDLIITKDLVVYAKVTSGMETVVINSHYSGKTDDAEDMTTAGWTAAAAGNAKVSPSGGDKDATDAVTCVKIDNTHKITSPKLTATDNTTEVTVKIFGSTTASSSAKQAKVIAYNAAGEELGNVILYTPAGKLGGYFTTAAGSGDASYTFKFLENVSYIEVTATDSNFNVYSIDLSYNKYKVTEEISLDYSGQTADAEDMTKAGWTAAAAGNAKVSPSGGNKDAADAVTCVKIDNTHKITSTKLTEATKTINVNIFGSTTASSSAKEAKVIAYAVDGTKLTEAILYTPAGKLGGYFTTAAGSGDAGCTLTSTTSDISYIEVTATDSNFNVYSININYKVTKFVDPTVIKSDNAIAYTAFSALPASNNVQTVADVFNFVVPNGIGLSGDSTAAQFSNGKIQFKVAAGATVTVQGYQGYSNYKINGTAYTNTNSVYFADATTVTIEANGLVCLYGIKVEFKGAPTVNIDKNTTITFGSEGNYKSVDHVTIDGSVRDNGGNNVQFSSGTITIAVAAGAKVKVYGYGGSAGQDDGTYTSYKVTANNATSETQNKDYEVTVTEAGNVVIAPVDGNNYLIKIEITF